MKISSIILKDREHQLAYPIEVNEIDCISPDGTRMMKLYNDEFKLLGYSDKPELARQCIQEEMNLIINSYLFDMDYIHKKPIFEETKQLQQKIRRYVYGI